MQVEETVALKVVTGQQIGLLGGPLYTTYKIIGAVKRARELKGEAVFWLETNDADFNEINHFYFLDQQDQVQKLTWAKNSLGYSAGWIEVDAGLVSLLEIYFAGLKETAHTPRLKELVMDCYGTGKTMGQASGQVARELYGSLGLTVFDPMNEEFRRFSRPILEREAEIMAAGEQCPVFIQDGKKRLAVFRTGKGYCLRDGREVGLGDYDLLPSVKNRNIIQDAFFQTHTYVAGPGEIQYIADMSAVYARHQITPPIIERRMSVNLVEPGVSRALRKLGIDIEDIFSFSRADATQRLLKEASGLDITQIEQQADSLSRSYLDSLQELGLDTQKIWPQLMKLVKCAVGEKRAETKRKQDGGLKKLAYIYSSLRPLEKIQERTFNIFYYMNLYGGKEFISWLADHYDPNSKNLEIRHD